MRNDKVVLYLLFHFTFFISNYSFLVVQPFFAGCQ